MSSVSTPPPTPVPFLPRDGGLEKGRSVESGPRDPAPDRPSFLSFPHSSPFSWAPSSDSSYPPLQPKMRPFQSLTDSLSYHLERNSRTPNQRTPKTLFTTFDPPNLVIFTEESVKTSVFRFWLDDRPGTRWSQRWLLDKDGEGRRPSWPTRTQTPVHQGWRRRVQCTETAVRIRHYIPGVLLPE